MARFFCIASLALAAVSAVSAHAIPFRRFHKRAQPSGWDAPILQDYAVYHERYLGWDCDKHHNTTFFEKCCHPLLKHESISVLTNLGCGAPSPEDECDDGESSISPSYTPSTTPQPTNTPSNETPRSSSPLPTSTRTPDNSKIVAPAPQVTESSSTSTPAPAPTTSTTSSSSPAPTSDGGNVNTGGQATFFYQNGEPGACGAVHQDSDFICAMDQARYGNSGNASPLCGKQVKITNTDNSKTVTVTVADDCPTCANSNSIDLSVAAFDAIADPSTGVVPILWEFVN